MEALGKTYSNGGGRNFLGNFAFGLAIGVVGSLVDEALATRQQERRASTYSQCYAANLASGVHPDKAGPLAEAQAVYLINWETRQKLWWRLPLHSIVFGILAFVLFLLMGWAIFVFWTSPSANTAQHFLFNHLEIWLVPGAVLGWLTLHSDAGLPLVPFTGNARPRPWFPGDPTHIARKQTSETLPYGTPPGKMAFRHHDTAAASLAKVEPDLRLILAKCQHFLSSNGERDTARAERLRAIQANVEPDFQRVRTALFAHDTPTAVHILKVRIQPVTVEIARLFGDMDF